MSISLINRLEKIKSKGFNIPLQDRDTDVYSQSFNTIDFAKIKVGAKTLDDAILRLGELKRINPNIADKTKNLSCVRLCILSHVIDFFFSESGLVSLLLILVLLLLSEDILLRMGFP